jgi:hypothetical protein
MSYVRFEVNNAETADVAPTITTYKLYVKYGHSEGSFSI